MWHACVMHLNYCAWACDVCAQCNVACVCDTQEVLHPSLWDGRARGQVWKSKCDIYMRCVWLTAHWPVIYELDVTWRVCVTHRKYCAQACEVEEPEVRFNIDQYSDVIMITKPVIYISVGEIVDTHSVSPVTLHRCCLVQSVPFWACVLELVDGEIEICAVQYPLIITMIVVISLGWMQKWCGVTYQEKYFPSIDNRFIWGPSFRCVSALVDMIVFSCLCSFLSTVDLIFFFFFFFFFVSILKCSTQVILTFSTMTTVSTKGWI